MTNHILFVFEGEVTEKQILEGIKHHHLNDLENTVIYGCYCTDIYSLFSKIEKDEDLDLFALIKEHTKNPHLADVKRDQVSEIFLFFDYDGHAPAASDTKIDAMLRFFDEETEHGKLYISYPMVESLKHLKAPGHFKDLAVPCKVNIKYKSLAHSQHLPGARDFTKIKAPIWKSILLEHCSKMNYIVHGAFELPEDYIDQEEIFSAQRSKYINKSSTVSVLSAFPVFICDYYGCSKLVEFVS